MEPEDSLPRSQEPAICLCPKSYEPIPRPHNFSKIHFNIMPSTPRTSKWSFSSPSYPSVFHILISFVADTLYIWPSNKQCHAGCLITVLSECTDSLWGHDRCTGAFGHCFRPRAVLYGQAECENGFRCAVCRSAGQFARYISDVIGWLFVCHQVRATFSGLGGVSGP